MVVCTAFNQHPNNAGAISMSFPGTCQLGACVRACERAGVHTCGCACDLSMSHVCVNCMYVICQWCSCVVASTLFFENSMSCETRDI